MDICTSMIPGYGGEPQTSAPPYHLKLEVLDGERLIITLQTNESAGNTTFRGFLLQMRNKEDKPFGEFQPEIETKLISCPPGQNNAATNDNSDTEIYQLKFTWSCPPVVNNTIQYVGETYAIATVVQEKTKFWTNIRSELAYINM